MNLNKHHTFHANSLHINTVPANIPPIRSHINTFEIEKIKRENEELNKANVRAYMTYRHSGSYSGTLVIKNLGKAPAYNINMHYLPHKIYRDYPITKFMNFFLKRNKNIRFVLVSELSSSLSA